MKKKVDFKAGDLISIEIEEGKYVTARVLFKSITKERWEEEQRKWEESPKASSFPGLVPATDALYTCAMVLEVYREVFDAPTPKQSEILLSGIQVSSYSVENGECPIIGHIPVNPAEVEFPEYVQYYIPKRGWYFCRGEVRLKLPDDPQGSSDIWRGLDGMRSTIYGGAKHYILYLLSNGEKGFSLEKGDLRFNKRRNEVYEVLGLNVGEPYYQFALRYGFDLERFYQE